MAAPAVGAAASSLGRQALIRAAMSRRSGSASRFGCGCVAILALVGAVAGVVLLAALTTTLAPLAGTAADAAQQIESGASLAPIACSGLQASQGYGDTPYEHPHTGIDLVCPAGTPVVAVVSGVFHQRWGADVACAFPPSARGGLGMYGEVDAGDVQYLYGHLEGFGSGDGTVVGPGTVIGFEGSSGCSTGFHLHFEVRVAGRATNPCPFLPQGYPTAHDAADVRCWGSAPP